VGVETDQAEQEQEEGEDPHHAIGNSNGTSLGFANDEPDDLGEDDESRSHHADGTCQADQACERHGTPSSC
jgi:hypothetical protein